MKFWATFNFVEFEMPLQAVRDCHHQGACDDDCEYWQKELQLNLERKPMIRELLEYGAWSARELCAKSNAELEQYLIWLGAGNIQESEEYENYLAKDVI